MVIRFANSLFEHLWNNKYIDNVQISSTETVGVESREATMKSLVPKGYDTKSYVPALT